MTAPIYSLPTPGQLPPWGPQLNQSLDYVKAQTEAANAAAASANARADAAYVLAQGAAGGSANPVSVALPGVVLLDSFRQGSEVVGSTVTDDTLLTRAMTYAAAQTLKPVIMWPNRKTTFTQTGRVCFDGMKFSGPWDVGMMNIEIASGTLNPTNTRINAGTGTAAWLVCTSKVNNMYIGNLCFDSSNKNTQFLHAPGTSGVGACTFHNLGFQAFKHVFGQPTVPMATTLVNCTGSWEMTTAQDTQTTIAGSDNDFWIGGANNIGPSGNALTDGAGRPLMIWRTEKTNVGGLFITADDNWRAMTLTGTEEFQSGTYFQGLRIEGRNTNDPATGALILVTGGQWGITQSNIRYGMSAPSTVGVAGDRALVQVSSGTLDLDMITTDKTAAIASTVPFLLVSGTGVAYATRIRWGRKGTGGAAYANLPIVQQTAAGKITNDATTQLVTAA